MRYIFLGKNYYIAIFSPICQGGKMAVYPFFRRGIYYIAIVPPIQVRGKDCYGGKWLYNTGLKSTSNPQIDVQFSNRRSI